jgi:hypothetical protein
MQIKRLDQFFTNHDVVDNCLSTIDVSMYDVVIEPSVGSGSFYNKIVHENIKAIDLEPQFLETIKMDFLKYNEYTLFDSLMGVNILVIGNPPFGKNSSLAVKFFKHASTFANTIAFVLPRTFRKPSVQNRLHDHFHLEKEIILPKNSFHTPDGKDVDVPCVWQIWERRSEIREKIIRRITHEDFMFVKREDADFLIQRVGGGAGIVVRNFTNETPKLPAYYNIKGYDEVCSVFERIDWDKSTKYDTAGNPSLSKDDIIIMYERYKFDN